MHASGKTVLSYGGIDFAIRLASDLSHPKQVAAVQSCRGSHTHSLLVDPKDKDNIYIYVSGTAGVRSADEVPGCLDSGIDDPNTARFRLEVIKVPMKAPVIALSDAS